ncbi:DUF1127 domain-containing protein [Roseovarius aestuarii]|nr:DUF1127 domain-containing protein [Roseovarius aestuarii]
MDTTRSIGSFDNILDAARTFFQHKRTALRKAAAQRATFRKVYAELSSLTQKDLKDLGISRSSIKRIALETAYDL